MRYGRKGSGFRAVIALAGGVVPLVGACSILVETTDLAGGGGAGDAAIRADAAPDVATEAAGDGGADAASDARWCERFGPEGGFCDDFDDPARTEPVVGWDGTGIDKGGALAIVPAGRSAPSALEATWAAHVKPPDGDCSYVRLLKELPAPVMTSFTFGFDVFLGYEGGAGFHDDTLTDIVWRAGADDRYCQLFLGGVLSDPGLNDDVTHRPLKKRLSVATWHRVELSVDSTSSAGSVTITIDGEEGFSSPQILAPGCSGPMKDVTMKHGLFCAGEHAAAERVLYDNVTFLGR